MMQNYMEVDPITGEKSYGALPEGEPLPEGAIAVDEQPSEVFASHCPLSGELVIDREMKADNEAGVEAIAAAHAQKRVEAMLHLSGINLNGLLSAEASATGTDINELATTIMERSQQMIDAEISRRMAKLKG